MKIEEEQVPLLLEIAAKQNKTTVPRMMSKDRTRFVVEARIMCYKILRDSGFTFASIGAYFDKHHSSVLHNLRQHERNYLSFNYYQEAFDSIIYALGYNTEDSVADTLILDQYKERLNVLEEKMANLKGENITLRRQLQKIQKTSKILTSNLNQICIQ